MPAESPAAVALPRLVRSAELADEARDQRQAGDADAPIIPASSGPNAEQALALKS